MKPNSVNNEQELFVLVRLLLILTASIGAVLTVVTHVAQMSRMPFSTYAIVSASACAVVAIILLWTRTSSGAFLAVTVQRRTALALLICGLMGALLSLASHRPNSDDAYYVSNVVHYLAHPEKPMGFDIHFIDSGSKPLVSRHVGTSMPFELAQGVVAYFGHIHFLTVYHFLTPALLGFMIPLVWFYLVSRFSFSSDAAVTGALLICLSLLLMGEKHRSFGNFAFNRIFQGKTVLFAVVVPFFVAMTMDFFRSRSARAWLYLLITSVAAVGLSSSACMLIPVLSVVLAIACCISYVPNMRSRALLGLCYLSTLVYPALYAGSFILHSTGQVGTNNPMNIYCPDNFLGHARYVFGPVAILFLVIGAILAIVFIQKLQRRFLLTWILLLFLCFLNPLVSPIMMRYVASQPMYWRLFFLLPFPLVIGLSGAGLVRYLESRSSKRCYLIVGMLIALLLLAHLPSSSSSVFRRGTILGFSGHKVEKLPLARQVLELAPPGTMLAMRPMSCSLPLLSAEYPQIVIRRFDLVLWIGEYGAEEQAVHRIKAQDYLTGETQRENYITKESLDSLIWVIRNNPQIKSVLASPQSARAYDSYLFDLLNQYGFTESVQTNELVLFFRPDKHTESEHGWLDATVGWGSGCWLHGFGYDAYQIARLDNYGGI